ncbi:MAG TPA: N-acetyl-gamma-glutamyl-phosphate reductase [Solirubrobacteraceae bacterium]|nr:N-acetyl-gamma-glutamyl-phosphate reductase [Solirubrobacteraceae bacterium]
MADVAAQPHADGAPRVLVAGASGFAGALAAQLLWHHPDFELAAVTARSGAGARLLDLYPRYRVPLVLSELDTGAVDADAAVVAYPHGASGETVAALAERGLRIVDLSADMRLRSADTYREWYGEHPHPELLGEAVYGLTELHRERIAAARIVGNPGCYPTAALLALAPLARAGLVADAVIDAKQGISGAGRAFDERTHLSYAGENIVPYSVGAHRHAPEIEEQLAALGYDGGVLFQAHLVPLDQGELVSCYVAPTRPMTGGELAELYLDAYRDEPFVEIAAQAPGVREVRETNFCRLHAAVDQRSGRLIIFAAIDNLWKGTSSQAIQNLNVMFGLGEERGLT